MVRRILTLTLMAVAIGTLATAASGQSKLKTCNVQSRPLTLQKSQKSLRLSGVVLGEATKEYRITTTSDMTVEFRMTTDSQLKFDVYLLDPPTAIEKGAAEWCGTFLSGKEYTLAVSNCLGKTSATYRIDVTSH